MGECKSCGKDMPSIIVRQMLSGQVDVSQLCDECFYKQNPTFRW